MALWATWCKTEVELEVDLSSLTQDVVVIKRVGVDSPGELDQEISNALDQRLKASLSFDRLMESVGNAPEETGNAI